MHNNYLQFILCVIFISALAYELLLRQFWVIWILKHLKLFCALNCFLIYVAA